MPALKPISGYSKPVKAAILFDYAIGMAGASDRQEGNYERAPRAPSTASAGM